MAQTQGSQLIHSQLLDRLFLKPGWLSESEKVPANDVSVCPKLLSTLPFNKFFWILVMSHQSWFPLRARPRQPAQCDPRMSRGKLAVVGLVSGVCCAVGATAYPVLVAPPLRKDVRTGDGDSSNNKAGFSRPSMWKSAGNAVKANDRER